MMRLPSSISGSGHRLAVLLLLSALVSCEGGGTGLGKVTIGAEGGTASLEEGSVTILISAGALSAETVFTATQISSSPPSDLVVPGSTYEIGPFGMTFEKLVTLTLSHDPANLPEGVREAELGLFRAVGNRWELVGAGSMDTSAHTVSGRVAELGVFGARGLSVATVEVSPASYALEQGQTKILAGVGRAASGFLLPERAATWTSSAEDVATVDPNGLVTALGMGSATITATIEGRSGSAQIGTWSCSSQSEIPAAECSALVDLYDAVNQQDWRLSTEWITSPDPCDWKAVTCEGGSVSTLFLGATQLPGVIPFSLGKLTNLSRLDLSGNRLSGSIPSSLGNLSSLTSLNLSSNDLSGSIPSEFEKLSSLTELILYWNLLSGPIPAGLGDLPNLTKLILNGNQLSGTIPSELGDLSNLLELTLLDNQLSGPIPPELGGLSSLSSLALSFNQLSGRIPSELGKLSNLSMLGLSRNQLSGPIPAELGKLSNLTMLFLEVNQLSGVVPLQVAQLGGLIQAMDGGLLQCSFVSFSPQVTNDLSIPDTQEYRGADLDGDGKICALRIGTG